MVSTNSPLQNGPQTPKGFEGLLRLMLAGIQTLIPVKSLLVVKGVSMTQAQVVAALQAVLAPFTAVRNAKAGLIAALQSKKQQTTGARALYDNVKQALIAQLGKQNPELGKFGLKPRNPPKPLTSTQKAMRAAKASVTRELRHTKGPVEKLKTKASVPTVQLGPDGVKVTPNAADMPTPTGAAGAAPAGSGTTSGSSDPAAAPATSTPPGSTPTGK